MSSEEEDEVVDAVEQERRWKVEAAITRTMKARIRVTHADLVGSVQQAWAALGRQDGIGVEFIESRIEYLRRREWFERLEDGSYQLIETE